MRRSLLLSVGGCVGAARTLVCYGTAAIVRRYLWSSRLAAERLSSLIKAKSTVSEASGSAYTESIVVTMCDSGETLHGKSTAELVQTEFDSLASPKNEHAPIKRKNREALSSFDTDSAFS